MVDVQRYISDGEVKREKIVMDIKYRRITAEDLKSIVREPEVQAAFFGPEVRERAPKSQWTQQYLSELACAAAAECFNAGYLSYLEEVAEYVSRKRGGVRLAAGIAVLVLAAAAVALALSRWNR